MTHHRFNNSRLNIDLRSAHGEYFKRARPRLTQFGAEPGILLALADPKPEAVRHLFACVRWVRGPFKDFQKHATVGRKYREKVKELESDWESLRRVPFKVLPVSIRALAAVLDHPFELP